ncbi:MAG TPA: EAL domain-containing protein [Usitatibacter sp.]|nr:EAL domain-containing protein [Usitatibacter sp.]
MTEQIKPARPFLADSPLPAGGRPVLIVWLFVGIVICLLGLTIYSVQLLGAGRAFVAAEGVWSKAQKDAVYYLSRYAVDRSEDSYQAYEHAMTVLEGDRRARTEFTKADPDMAVVREGLLKGGVHPTEIDGLVSMYARLRGFGPMDYAVSLWRRSDLYIDELQNIASRLRTSGPLSPEEMARTLQQIERVNRSVSPLEDDFAATLGEMQRTAQSLVVSGILIITGILLIAGISLSRRFLLQNQELQNSLSESESQLRHLIESAPLPLLIVRAGDQELLYANERALEQFGLNADTLRSHRFNDFHVEPEAGAMLAEALSRQGTVREFEVYLRAPDGRKFWLLLSAQPMRYAGSFCLLCALANIDDKKRMQEDMRRKAMYDTLTGLPNRAMFMEALMRAMRKSRRRSSRFSVLFIDLDRFKEINDTMGHHAGDELLQTVAQRLGTAIRQSDLVARLGGDEFVVLIEDHGGPEEVMIVAQKIISMLERPIVIDWREVVISGSIGIASYPEDGTDVDTIVKNADAAMYRAKELGRNNFQFYSPELNLLGSQRLQREKQVREALDKGELFLHYQPEIDFESGRFVAMEALLRWRDPGSGVVLAPEFLPMAEESGTINAVGRWVIDRALADLAAWRKEGFDVLVSVNVAARQLQQPEFPEEVRNLLVERDVPPRLLRLEVTELTLMQDSDVAHRAIKSLRALGVEIAIDDFGTGYSSLGLVRGLPIQVLKIDRTLVSSCLNKKECAAIVQATSAMSRVLGIRLVAEGVETEEQRHVMQALGCDAGQGFLFAAPIEPDKVPELLRSPSEATLTG